MPPDALRRNRKSHINTAKVASDASLTSQDDCLPLATNMAAERTDMEVAEAIFQLLDTKWFGTGSPLVLSPPSMPNQPVDHEDDQRPFYLARYEYEGPSPSVAPPTLTIASQPRRISNPDGDPSFSKVKGPNENVAAQHATVETQKGQLQQQQQLPLGTWANRQIRLLKDDADSTNGQEGNPGSLVSAFLREEAAKVAQDHNRAAHGEDDVEDAAWRWRFTRRWHAEQIREIDPSSGSASDLAEQPGMGKAWNMRQPSAAPLNRNDSLDMTFLMHSLTKNGSTLGGRDSEEAVLGDWTSSQRQAFLGMEASREMQSITSKAELLAAENQKRNTDAKPAWDQPCQSGGQWIGNLLPTVEIDTWGNFRFIMIKITNLAGQKCILVQGHNHCTEAGLVESANRRVMQLSIQHGLRSETLLIMGGGIMEWRRDRDKCLNLHSGYCSDMSIGTAARAKDLLQLAASLVRTCIPADCTVSVGE